MLQIPYIQCHNIYYLFTIKAHSSGLYKEYVTKLIPIANQPLLEVIIDEGSDTDLHLHTIAKSITEWEMKLVGPLELTREEVADIKAEVQQPLLRRLVSCRDIL